MSEPRLPKFVPLPAELIFSHDLPAHLYRLYVRLLSLAWIHDYEWFDYRLEDVARTLDMDSATLNKYVQQLTNLGYVTRERVGPRRWRTRFHVRWSVKQRTARIDTQLRPGVSPEVEIPSAPGCTPDAASVDRRKTDDTQQHEGPDSLGGIDRPTRRDVSGSGDPTQKNLSGAGNPARNNHYDVDGVEDLEDSDIEQQQQHHNYNALLALGVRPDVADDLVERCDPEEVTRWIEHTIAHEDHLFNPAGLLVQALRRGRPAPELTRRGEKKVKEWRWRMRYNGWEV